MARIALFILFLSLACSRSGGGEKEKSARATSGGELKGVRIVETRWGRKSFELIAKEIEEKPESTYIYDFSVVFLGSEGETLSTLKADSGIYIKNSGDIEARGDVVVVSQDGTRLSGEELFYSEGEKKIFSNKRVKIFRKGKTIVSEGFESDPSLKHIKLKGEVMGRE